MKTLIWIIHAWVIQRLPVALTLQIVFIWFVKSFFILHNIPNCVSIMLCFYNSILATSVPFTYSALEAIKHTLSMIAMHAGKGLLNSRLDKNSSWCKTYFLSLKSVLAFQTLMVAMLGKWAIFFLEQGLLFYIAAWIDLTSNANNSIVVSSFQHHTTLCSFKTCLCLTDLSRLYDASKLPGRHAGYFTPLTASVRCIL